MSVITLHLETHRPPNSAFHAASRILRRIRCFARVFSHVGRFFGVADVDARALADFIRGAIHAFACTTSVMVIFPAFGRTIRFVLFPITLTLFLLSLSIRIPLRPSLPGNTAQLLFHILLDPALQIRVDTRDFLLVEPFKDVIPRQAPEPDECRSGCGEEECGEEDYESEAHGCDDEEDGAEEADYETGKESEDDDGDGHDGEEAEGEASEGDLGGDE